MKKILLFVPLLFLGCSDETNYFKLHQEFDCRDGELYATLWYAHNVNKDENISTANYIKGVNMIVVSQDESRILCIEK